MVSWGAGTATTRAPYLLLAPVTFGARDHDPPPFSRRLHERLRLRFLLDGETWISSHSVPAGIVDMERVREVASGPEKWEGSE